MHLWAQNNSLKDHWVSSQKNNLNDNWELKTLSCEYTMEWH